MKSSLTSGIFRMWLLRDNPMKSAFEYAYNGLNDVYDGVQILVEEGKANNPNIKNDDDPRRLHLISAKVRDEESQLIN